MRAAKRSYPVRSEQMLLRQRGHPTFSERKRSYSMARDHRNVAVVIAFDTDGHGVAEDNIPVASYRVSGTILLNSPDVRRAKGIRFISTRLFNEEGHRIEVFGRSYASDGHEVEALHRRPDNSIIEKLPWE